MRLITNHLLRSKFFHARSIPLLIVCVLLFSVPAAGQTTGTVQRTVTDPQPGDLYRDYVWVTPPGHRRPQRSQEVFNPELPYAPAGLDPNPKAFLNHIVVDDLKDAVKVEVIPEIWSGLRGTNQRRVRVNSGAWLTFAEPEGIPDARGVGGPLTDHGFFYYPRVSVPVTQMKQGVNSFMFDASGGKGAGYKVWGVTFRVYYDPALKPHSEGAISSPKPGAQLGDEIVLGVSLTDGPIEQPPKRRPVLRVDYIGHYEDFNIRGDGANLGWQYRMAYGAIQDHIGAATVPTLSLRWKTAWVPDQVAPMKIMALIVDDSLLTWVTPVVDGLTFGRRSVSVKLYKGHDVPAKFHIPAGTTVSNKVHVADDPLRGRGARMFVPSWSICWADAIGVNGKKVSGALTAEWNTYLPAVIDLPVKLLKKGVNEAYVSSTATGRHGVEILWPGMEIKVQYPAQR